MAMFAALASVVRGMDAVNDLYIKKPGIAGLFLKLVRSADDLTIVT
jgi:hypothetical protein